MDTLKQKTYKKTCKNEYISSHVVFIMRFYEMIFYLTGFMRLKYCGQRRGYRLTEDSVNISFTWGIIFAIISAYMLVGLYLSIKHNPKNFPVYFALITLLVNQLLHLLRLRGAVKQRVRLLNRHLQCLRQIQQLTGRKVRLSLLVFLQVFIKFCTISRFIFVRLQRMNTKSQISPFIFAVFVAATWNKDIPNHIFFIGLKVIEKSFEQLNVELEIATTALQHALYVSDSKAIRRMNKRIFALRGAYTNLVRLAHDFARHIEPHLSLTFMYDVSNLLTVLSYADSYPLWWYGVPTAFLCLNSLRFLCATFQDITDKTQFPFEPFGSHCSSSMNVAALPLPMLLVNLTSCANTLAAGKYDGRKRFYRNKDFFLPILMQPCFTLFGKIKADKQIVRRTAIWYCSLLYIFYMHKNITY